MECDLNGFQSIRCVNGHVDILYSYDVSFAVQYIYQNSFVVGAVINSHVLPYQTILNYFVKHFISKYLFSYVKRNYQISRNFR